MTVERLSNSLSNHLNVLLEDPRVTLKGQDVQHVPDQHHQLLPGGDSGGPGPGQPGQWGSARRHPPHRPQAPPRLSLRARTPPGGQVWQHREAESEDPLDQPGQQSRHCQHSGQLNSQYVISTA